MKNPWFRMYAEFATDPKVQMMSETLQRRYIMLLCLRCNGDVTLQDEEIAFQLRISNDDWQDTKAAFVAKNLIDEQCNVVAWNKRQYQSDSSAGRVAAHRERKKQGCNVTVTPPDTDTDTDTDISTPSGVDSTRKRGARLSADAVLSDDWAEFCKSERPDLDPASVFSKFKDYWLSKPGKAGSKLDWFATWRNWVREERAPPKSGTAARPPITAAEKYAAQRDAMRGNHDRTITGTAVRVA